MNDDDTTRMPYQLPFPKDAQEEIMLAPYEDYVKKFEEAAKKLLAITPTVESVDDLVTEDDEAAFIKAFRDLIRIKNVLDCFSQFDFSTLPIDEQTFADYRSKYLDLYDKVRSDRQKEKVSILDDLDFEIELITRDKITVSYIITLLKNLQNADDSKKAKIRKTISDVLDTDAQLRSKKELIERFALDKGKDPQHYALGFKELWRIPKAQHQPGLVVHGAGWPLDDTASGGSFLYHLDDDLVSVGLIVDLNYRDPYLSPFDEFQRLKHHPLFAKYLSGGERLSYGARAIAKGATMGKRQSRVIRGASLPSGPSASNPSRNPPLAS